MVFVTGGAGYIGSHTVRALVAAGQPVTIFDRFPKGEAGVPHGVRTVRGDLANLELLTQSLRQSSAPVVLHFAGYIAAGESMQQPTKYFHNNVSCGINLLEAMLRCGVRRIIFSSSAGVYGDPERLPIPEDHPCRPTSVYGETKYLFERLLGWYDRTHGIKAISLRYFNAAGAHPSGEIGEAHEPETHLIPIALDAVLGVQKELLLFGDDYPTRDGTCVRDYIHVMDLADAHLLALDALQSLQQSGVYNLGNGVGYSNLEVIRTIEQVTGRRLPYRVVARRAGDPAELYASSDRARRELGWTPRYPELASIVQSAWAWHRKLRGG
jgi:UDP-glucose 4-epimerase